MRGSKESELLAQPRVVGTVHSPGALRHALRLKPGAVDLLELRVDHFVDDLEPLRRAVPKLKFPYIVTVRHPKEGGAGNLSLRRRLALYREFLAGAALVDVELRSVKELEGVVKLARNVEITVIVSDHYFKKMPRVTDLMKRRREAVAGGAEIVKVAAVTSTPKDVAGLLKMLQTAKRPMSVMGMGPLGKVSRLLFARAGSCLNYGYLDQPQVPGQWAAETLKKRLEEVMSEA